MSEPRFIDGDYFDQVVQTAIGTVGISAEVHILDDHLVLENLLFYPIGADVLKLGVREVFSIRKRIETLAKEEGFIFIVLARHQAGTHPNGKRRTDFIMTSKRKL